MRLCGERLHGHSAHAELHCIRNFRGGCLWVHASWSANSYPSCLLVFLFGVIFLAFDIRLRDIRDRMVGVIESRPFSNFDLLIGRLTGITLLVLLVSSTLTVLVRS